MLGTRWSVCCENVAKDFQPLILRNPDFRFGFRIEAQDRLAGAVVTDERHLVASCRCRGRTVYVGMQGI